MACQFRFAKYVMVNFNDTNKKACRMKKTWQASGS